MRDTLNTGLNSGKTIYDAIQAISRHTLINPRTNTTYNGNMTAGFVAKVHDDENDELYGTVDVKEYNARGGSPGDMTFEGYHEGVRLSAIQDSRKGLVIIPKLFSDVVIAQDPETLDEYVTMFSHADYIQIDSHKTITVGVREREEFDPDDEDAPDIEELELTGKESRTTYTKDSVRTEVVDGEGGNTASRTVTAESVGFDVGGGDTVFKATGERAELTRDDVSALLQKGEFYVKAGGEFVKVTPQAVYLGSDSDTSPAVLGTELGKILCNILDMIGQIKTATMMGPQPPVNLPQFIAAKAQVNAWTSSVSNFLTKKVNVQR